MFETRAITQLVGCAYEGGTDVAGARRALEAVGLLDRDGLLGAALAVDLAPTEVRDTVADLLAGVIGSLNPMSDAR